jgi:hypothetical protein
MTSCERPVCVCVCVCVWCVWAYVCVSVCATHCHLTLHFELNIYICLNFLFVCLCSSVNKKQTHLWIVAILVVTLIFMKKPRRKQPQDLLKDVGVSGGRSSNTIIITTPISMLFQPPSSVTDTNGGFWELSAPPLCSGNPKPEVSGNPKPEVATLRETLNPVFPPVPVSGPGPPVVHKWQRSGCCGYFQIQFRVSVYKQVGRPTHDSQKREEDLFVFVCFIDTQIIWQCGQIYISKWTIAYQGNIFGAGLTYQFQSIDSKGEERQEEEPNQDLPKVTNSFMEQYTLPTDTNQLLNLPIRNDAETWWLTNEQTSCQYSWHSFRFVE